MLNVKSQDNDWRNLENAISIIPDEGYCDQPYTVINKKGEWVCTLTTGEGHEGQSGQHVVATISADKGKTWTKLIDIEPSSGPEASWVVPFITPYGRIYAFYTYNSENWRAVLDAKGNEIKRVDTFGKMMMKYSDDGGYTWSDKRYEVPIRNFNIDDNNIYKGKVQFFWSVAIPVIHKNSFYFPLSKVGNFGEGFMVSGSGAIIFSDNILTEKNPDNIRWETLPDGKEGLLPPQGTVADEHNIVSMNDGSLYCVYRTNQGHNVHAYSRDDGHTWTKPEWASYTPGGKIMKQPRCFNKVYKFSNGKYALFFHNNGARHYSSHPIGSRNPTWISGGVEKDGNIYWSQPEVFLYDMDYVNGISYPDWIEENGKYYFSETQKTIARIHEIPSAFMEMLWAQAENSNEVEEGLLLNLQANQCKPEIEFEMPELGKLINGNGFALELSLKTGSLKKDQLILKTNRERTEGYGYPAKFAGNGIEIKILKEGFIQLILDDGRSPVLWNSPVNSIQANTNHHIVINVDAKAKIITMVIDGDLCDGGERPFGYARFNPYMYDVNGDKKVSFSKSFKGEVLSFKVYNRFLYTSEGIANYKSKTRN